MTNLREHFLTHTLRLLADFAVAGGYFIAALGSFGSDLMRSVITLACAVGLSLLAGLAVAQDAPKADAPGAAAPARQSDTSSDHRKSRAERRAEADASASAKPQTLTEFPKTASAKSAKPKMECRKQEVTGSRMGKTICATPEQWAEADAAGEAAAKEMRREANSRAGAARDMGPYRGGNTL